MRLFFTCLLFSFHYSSTAQIPSYVPTNGLVGYWPFNGNANDESGNGNNGVNYGATPTLDRRGVLNSAYSFNGSSNYISVPYSTSIGVQQNISVSFWVYFNGGSCGPRIMQTMPWGQCGGYYISSSSNSNISRYLDGGINDCSQNVVASSSYLSSLIWHHVVWTASGLNGNVQFYFDGQLANSIATNNFLSSINYNNRSLIIGNIDPNSCDWFGGFLDDIAIYNRVLSQPEITQLYTSTTTPTTPEDTTSNVGIGTVTPKRKLHVNDVMRLEPRNTAPVNPAKGDIYFDGVLNKLRVYDGTVWQNCW